jgi:hypothetical protein
MGRASSQGRKQGAWGAIRCPAAHRETNCSGPTYLSGCGRNNLLVEDERAKGEKVKNPERTSCWAFHWSPLHLANRSIQNFWGSAKVPTRLGWSGLSIKSSTVLCYFMDAHQHFLATSSELGFRYTPSRIKMIADETEKWGKVVKFAGISPSLATDVVRCVRPSRSPWGERAGARCAESRGFVPLPAMHS